MPRRPSLKQKRQRFAAEEAGITADEEAGLARLRGWTAGLVSPLEVGHFESGYRLAVAEFWADIARGRERSSSSEAGRNEALKGIRAAATAFENAVLRAAIPYRYQNPGAGDTRMAMDLADVLQHPDPTRDDPDHKKSASAVRHVLAKLRRTGRLK